MPEKNSNNTKSYSFSFNQMTRPDVEIIGQPFRLVGVSGEEVSVKAIIVPSV